MFFFKKIDEKKKVSAEQQIKEYQRWNFCINNDSLFEIIGDFKMFFG